MHRSGTSCLAGSLQRAGLYLGDVGTNNIYNAKGNREFKPLNALLDQVLNENEGSWINPPTNANWSHAHYNRLCSIVSSFSEHDIWGFKNPRSLFLLDGIERCITNLTFIGSYRNPNSVVASLLNRNPDIGDREFWLELWYAYNKRMLDVWEQHKFHIIDFDANTENYLASLKTLCQQLDLEPKLHCNDSSFFDHNLRSMTTNHTEDLPQHIKNVYYKLQSIYNPL